MAPWYVQEFTHGDQAPICKLWFAFNLQAFVCKLHQLSLWGKSGLQSCELSIVNLIINIRFKLEIFKGLMPETETTKKCEIIDYLKNAEPIAGPETEQVTQTWFVLVSHLITFNKLLLIGCFHAALSESRGTRRQWSLISVHCKYVRKSLHNLLWVAN